MSKVKLTTEQQYLLRRVAVEAQDLSRDELIEALCDCWEARFLQKQIFEYSSREAGFVFQVKERLPLQQPETEEEFTAIFGYLPTEEEAMAYLEDLQQIATMELDMDEIVLTPDDD
jgi:FMN phosphatase YigB (HAD superfamily)